MPSTDLDDLESDEDNDYCEVDERDLTPEVLSGPCAKSRKQIVTEGIGREDRLELVYETWLQGRYAELEDCYQYLVETRQMDEQETLPNRHDGARLWTNLAWADLSRRSITRDMFLELAEQTLEAKIAIYRKVVRKALASLVPRDPRRDVRMLRYKFPGLVLGLPEALFACVECGKPALPWPDINEHWRTAHPNKSIWFNWDRRQLNVRWWWAGANIASQIFRAARLEGVVNVTLLNAAISTGRLLCNCRDPCLKQAPELTWSELVLHVHSHLQANEDKKGAPSGEDGAHVWINDHEPDRCIISLGDSDDVPAQRRTPLRATQSSATRILKVLNSCPRGTLPICRICEKMTSNPRGVSMVLQKDADAVAYHMEVKHGRKFDEGDVVFGRPWYLPRYYR